MTGFVTERFRRLVAHLLEIEGGAKVVNLHNDRGGLTKWGISRKSYPEVDIANLSREGAIEIYHRDFYKPLKLDQLLDEPLASAVFDMGVNAGIGTAAKLLQRAINALGKPLSVNGRIGPATTALVNALPPQALRYTFRRACRRYYEDIVAGNPSQRVFLKGWLNRIGEPPEARP